MPAEPYTIHIPNCYVFCDSATFSYIFWYDMILAQAVTLVPLKWGTMGTMGERMGEGIGYKCLWRQASMTRDFLSWTSLDFSYLELLFLLAFSRKRPRRVLSKKALSLKSVIKDCLQASPKVLLKWWLSLKIVIKHRPKFYWSDGCL